MEILDHATERVRRARALHQRSVRRREGRFLVEGPQGVREAVAYAAAHVRAVYLTPAAAERYPEIAGADAPVQLATDAVLADLSTDAQGVLAVVDTAALDAGLGGIAGEARLLAVLAGANDPGNAGTVIRAADAAGADGVVLVTGSVELTNPKVVRSTAGSIFHLPVVTGVSLDAAVGAAHDAGLTVLAADGAGRFDLHALGARGDDDAPRLAAPTAWVFGNEAHGLNAEQLALTDAAVRVPLYGKAESLNLATAATVCLYASAAAQRA